MAAIKGHIKSGGRKAGTPNKSTQDMRAWINEFLNDNREQVIEDMAKLEPYQRVQMFEKLLSFAVPKQQSLSVEAAVQAEYNAIEKLLNDLPDRAIELITEKILMLNQLNKLEK